ncbi:MAG TPA: DUF4446 family protein [Egibacteraceae bacterium]|nr:DUF4446 family protein [Egibacteraceae bacterium]
MALELTTATVGLLLVAAIALAAIALALSTAALVGQRRVRGAYRAFSLGSRDDVLTLLQRHIDAVEGLRQRVDGVQSYAQELRGLLRSGVSRVATVRYDAFDDMGGRMSFSAALLDENGDGLVLTSINGRTETRTYAKPVLGGNSRHNLSEEEERAIADAMAQSGRGGPREREVAAARRSVGPRRPPAPVEA